MTDPLARLRAEIKADIDEHLGRIEHEERRVQVLREVIERMDRIEAECPVPAVPEAPAGRAPRRDLQAAVMTMVAETDPNRIGLTRSSIRDVMSHRMTLTDSALNRTLIALVDAGKLTLLDSRYRLPPKDIAEQDTSRRVPRAVDAAAE